MENQPLNASSFDLVMTGFYNEEGEVQGGRLNSSQGPPWMGIPWGLRGLEIVFNIPLVEEKEKGKTREGEFYRTEGCKHCI